MYVIWIHMDHFKAETWIIYPQRIKFRDLWLKLQTDYPEYSSLSNKALTTRWRHQMGTFTALLALCEGNPPVTGRLPPKRPVTRSFYVFSGACLNKRLKQSIWRWFETPWRSLWRHCNDTRANSECCLNEKTNPTDKETAEPLSVCEPPGTYLVPRPPSWLITHWGRDKMDANS